MQTVDSILKALSLSQEELGCYDGQWHGGGAELQSLSPADGSILGTVRCGALAEYEKVVEVSQEVFLRWRALPAPKRGELVYEISRELRLHRETLGALISWEMGKILAEGIGEVQEAIDIADFSVGLSRQLYGLTMHSERATHRMYEQWHPLGPVGVITAFNFPVAVWAWNAMIALVCGNPVIWKPSDLTPLTSIALMKICGGVCERFGYPGLLSLLIDSDASYGKALAADRRIPLISATGSTEMGRSVGSVVAQRLGRSLLELGGNNAIIVCNDADIDLALRAVVFGAVGTAGQRCTTTRRLFVERGIYDSFCVRLQEAYQQIRIGHPLAEGTLCGPLVNRRAVEVFLNAVNLCKDQQGEILIGGSQPDSPLSDCYVQPTIVKAPADMPLLQVETFAPLLYVVAVDDLPQAIQMQNSVPQGLSSAIFTASLKNSELFLSTRGSDCGIANVNIGTSGAEIGGAFGGEKDTGGGREAGSDSWKAYMRRQTNTINWGDELPLAQGIRFE